MSLPKIPVAAVQPGSHNRDDFDEAWPAIVALADDAGRRGARLIVLPEGTVPGYVLGTAPVSEAQIARAAIDMTALAARHRSVVVYGSARIEEGRVYNAAICVGPDGTELGFAAKQFLWHFDRRWFAKGETLQPVVTPLGVLGLLVCADGRIPTIAATLVERGAQILVMPTAWVTSGRDPQSRENAQADLMANVRARENGVPFVVANKCGVELQSVAYCGKSAVIDARGEFVARGSETDVDIVLGDVALTPGRDGRVHARAVATDLALPQTPRPRARIAFSPSSDGDEIDRLAALAAVADCDILIARGSENAVPDVAYGTGLSLAVVPAASHEPRLATSAGWCYATVDDATMRDPLGLVALRLAGVDTFVWTSEADDGWNARFARTRAAELRAYVIVFETGSERSFAVDPDGVIIAGTFGDFRMASFVYDRGRAQATVVAPTTDVIDGLRAAKAIRDREGALAEASAHGR